MTSDQKSTGVNEPPTSGDCDNENGTINDGGHNLVEDGSCGFSVGGDPLLDPLVDNGGETLTHALSPHSPAIDAIPVDECSLANDQRGVARPQGDGCDIGAYETRSISLHKLVDNPTPIPGETITFTIRVGITQFWILHQYFGDLPWSAFARLGS